MPNTKQTIKRVRQNEKRRLHNRAIRSRMARAIRLAEEAIADNTDNAEEAVKAAVSEIARTNSKGIIHRNKASRQTSRLMSKLNASRQKDTAEATS